MLPLSDKAAHIVKEDRKNVLLEKQKTLLFPGVKG